MFYGVDYQCNNGCFIEMAGILVIYLPLTQ